MSEHSFEGRGERSRHRGRAGSEVHGAETIQSWLDDLVAVACSGKGFTTSAGAEPHRDYAYLEFHDGNGRHSILVFSVSRTADGVRIRTDRFDGDAESVRSRVDALVHGERPPRASGE